MDNSTDAPGLLPGQSPPLSAVNATEQDGVLVIATALGLVFALISSFIRLFVRLEFSSRFAKDDVASFFSTVLAIVQSSVVFVAISKGFGKTVGEIPSVDMPAWQKDVYASDLLYIVGMWLTKCSAAFLFLRLSPDRVHMAAAKALLAASTVFMLISVLAVALRCSLAHPWLVVGEQCSGLFPPWIATAVFDILTEMGIFLIALLLVQGLQLPLQKKCVIMLAFGLRLPVMAASILRLSYLGSFVGSADPSLDGTIAAVCTQVELSYAIVATTMPCLKPFMAALNTSYGGTAAVHTPAGTTKGSISSATGLSRAGAAPRADVEKASPEQPSPPGWADSHYNVEVHIGGSGADDSSNQNRISRNTSWAVDYQPPAGDGDTGHNIGEAA